MSTPGGLHPPAHLQTLDARRERQGLLLNNGGDELISWRTLALGWPHHAAVMATLGVARERVVACLAISADGDVTVAGGAVADELVERACALDERLRPASNRWPF